MNHGSSVVSTRSSHNMPRLVSITPALNRKLLTLELSGAELRQKKYNQRSNPYCGAQAASIARRNARERNRVKQVNDSFNALRRRLPTAVVAALSHGSRRGTGKKLSKVDTLRMVVEYIRHLEELLKENNEAFDVTPQEDEHLTTKNNEIWSKRDELDDGFFCGSNSPYSDSIPSPVSDSSSGVSMQASSVNYFSGCYQPLVEEQLSPIEDNLLDSMSWWHHK